MPGAPVTAALLAALPQEVRPFLRLVRARRLPQGALPVWAFDFAGRTGVAALTGMGASRAAGAAASLLEHYQPRAIIAAGFGGAVTPELPPGGLVLGETFWRYEPETGTLQELAAPASPIPLAEVLARLTGAGRPAFRGVWSPPPASSTSSARAGLSGGWCILSWILRPASWRIMPGSAACRFWQ